MTVPFAMYLMVVFFEYYGFARFVPQVNAFSISLITSVSLLIYVLSEGTVRVWLREKQVVLLLILLSLTAASVLHSLVSLYSLNVLKGQVGYFILFVVTLYFVSDERRSRVLAWVLVLIHTVLVVESRELLFNQVRVGHFAGGYFMGDGNDFAWGLNIAFPFAVYLFSSSRSFVSRSVSLGACFVLVVGILGTASRGASLALGGALLGLVFMSNRKFIGMFILLVVVTGVLLFAPSSYFGRMQTIGEYSEDTSAQGRLEAWGAAIRMAMEYPLGVGAGNFNSAYGRFYRSADFFSPRWISPHSIYFLVLGEYGFLGLGILLAILFLNFKGNLHSEACLRKRKNPSVSPSWPMFINLSLISYSIAGAFLGGINYPHLYMLTALTLGAKVMASKAD